MMAASAPAAAALRAFTAKPQVPRSISATLPATAAAFVNAEHPSVVAGPAASAASAAATRFPVTLGVPTGGPKLAVPNWYSLAIDAGAFTTRPGLPNDSTLGSAEVTPGVSRTTRPNRVPEASRSASVISDQCRPVLLSSSLRL